LALATASGKMSKWDEPIGGPRTNTSIRTGVRTGFGFGAIVSVIAVGRILLVLLGFGIAGKASGRDVSSAARMLAFAIPGYLVAFSFAGAMWAAASHLNSRILRYTLTGLFGATAIYGAAGIGVATIDDKTPNWLEIASVAGTLGVLFGFLGFVMAILDDWHERRRA
jgi:hypothetical protein